MRSRTLLSTALVAIGCSLGWLAASGRLGEAFAQDSKPQTTPGTQLPKPDPEFKGTIGRTFKESTPDYPSR